MDDAGTVDGLQRLGDPGHEQQDRTRRERAVVPDGLLQGRAGDVGGDEPRDRIVHPGIDHLGGEQSVDAAGAGDLVGEPQAESVVRSEVLPYRLQSDGTTAPGVGEVDHTHAPGAEPGLETVAADLPRVFG